MKRKVMELGHSCYVVSLPKKWVDANKIEKGDELNLDILGSSLTYRSDVLVKERLVKKIVLEGSDERLLRTILVNIYRAGFDVIDLIYAGDFNLLKEVVSNNLIGFEVFSLGNSRFSVESVSEPLSSQSDKLLEKLFFIIKELLKDPFAESVLDYVLRIRSYDNFLKRVLSKKYSKPSADFFLWRFYTDLVHTSSEINKLNKLDVKNIDEKYLNKLLEIPAKMFSKLHTGFLKQDISLLLTLHEDELQFSKNKEDLFYKLNPLFSFHILKLVSQIYLSSSSLVGYLESI